ncbi:MFS transporter [Leifsonia poae]|uniref:MFS transporter n=1 Tax=Leifsonia poae TaxID=110933 RepID=UPI001CC0ABBC|nr:MFS transporter [Leifsonia poae]
MSTTTPASSGGEPDIDETRYIDETPLTRAAGAAADERIIPVETAHAPAVRPQVGPLYVWMMVLATFGVYIAFVAPIAISLALKLQQVEPAHQEYLGYIIGIGAAVAVLSAPIVGILSDRTRLRMGRRRPYLLVGSVVGAIALVIMAAAPSTLVLGIGWAAAQLGWGSALTVLTIIQADKLPEEQRGKVAGLVGFVQMVAPVVGAGIASAFVADDFLMFLVPGAVGVVFTLLFVAVVKDADARTLPAPEGAIGAVLRKYLYSPRQHADFSWNWLARLLFNVGVTFNTTFSIYFITSRVGGTIQDFAPYVAINYTLLYLIAAAFTLVGGALVVWKVKSAR